MCDHSVDSGVSSVTRTVPITEAVGLVLAHDVTEIRTGEFKGRAFKKGHVIRHDDIHRLQQIGKDHLYVLTIGADEVHEDVAAVTLACALMGDGVAMQGEPKEGKVRLVAARDGLLTIDRDALLQFNLLGDVICGTLHNNTVVRKDRVIAETKAVPLVVKRTVIDQAVSIAGRTGIVRVKEIRKPKAGVVITGNEVYHGRVKDGFAPVIAKKIEAFGGEIIGTAIAPDDKDIIRERLRELLDAGADLLITTGGMSVDPDDVTRFAIRDLGATDLVYGSPVLPGAMLLVAYLENVRGAPDRNVRGQAPFGVQSENSKLRTQNSEPIPILGVPACGMYHKTTVLDLVLPRLLAGERIGRRELAELGHGGLCLHCSPCQYPICPFGK
jgi:molybdenum cofactor synthesis domain-containing protein